MRKIMGYDVKEAWKYMAGKYNFKQVTMGDTKPAIAVNFLKKLGIDQPEKWMNSHTITLLNFFQDQSYVFTNFTPGVARGRNQQYHFRKQLGTLAHECDHVKNQDFEWFYWYLKNKSSRTRKEIDGLTCNMDLDFYLGGSCSPSREANKLKGYRVNASNVAFAHRVLIDRAEIIEQGKIHQKTSRDLIKFLASRGLR
jgi:hypothetical protein